MKKITATLLLATCGAAFAQTGPTSIGSNTQEFYPFKEIMAMKMMDKNKDGMVSKQEFMDMMSMAWDMQAKKMGVKGDQMTPIQFDQVRLYLSLGG